MFRGSGCIVVVVFCGSSQLFAGSHTWDVNEVFSNADGSIQFVELRENNGTPNEAGIGGHNVTSNTQFVTIPSHVLPPTSNKHYLIATVAFAALPGAPTPDLIIPAGSVPFFNTAGDTVSYVPWDSFIFGPVPTDGINSLNDPGTVAPNSPTNYAGATGSVDASGGPYGDLDGDGDVDLIDFAVFAGCMDGPGVVVPGTPCGALDADSDGDVDEEEFAEFQRAFTGS